MFEDPKTGAIFKEFDVRVAYLFGSRASGRPGPGSDADIAILAENPLGLLQRERLADRLARALGVPDVDVVQLEEASLELRGHALQQGRLIFCNDDARRVQFETRTRSEWFDFEPTLRMLTKAYLERVAERGLRG